MPSPWCPWRPPYVLLPAFPVNLSFYCISPGAATLAFAIQSGVNLILLLARVKYLTKCVRSSVPTDPHPLNRTIQGEAFRSRTPCPVRFRFVPCRCHVRLVHHSLHTTPLTAIVGSFVSLYPLILNALPLVFPANIPVRENLRNLLSAFFLNQDEGRGFVVADSPASSLSPPSSPSPALSLPLHILPGDRLEARLSSSAQVHQDWVAKKTRQWHSVLAGAVAGAIGVSFEKRSRQIVVAQQLFVRYVLFTSIPNSSIHVFPSGLQGSYNAYSEKRGFRIPHGEVLIFSLAYGHKFSLAYSVLISEKVRTDCVCVPFEPAHAPKVIFTLVRLRVPHVYLRPGL
jgi:hypothetical protein